MNDLMHEETAYVVKDMNVHKSSITNVTVARGRPG
jgi:hypothetical protein